MTARTITYLSTYGSLVFCCRIYEVLITVVFFNVLYIVYFHLLLPSPLPRPLLPLIH